MVPTASYRTSIAAGDFMLGPIVVFSLAVLVLNDHVAKARWPGWWTGKLSDAAGMVFFPVLLVAMAEVASRAAGRKTYARPSWFVLAAVMTGLTFALVKTTAIFRVPYAEAIGASQWAASLPWRLAHSASAGTPHAIQVIADGTDVFAVAFVLVPVWIGYRYRNHAGTSTLER